MIWIVIAIVIILITITLLKNTHVIEYYNNGWGKISVYREFDMILTVGHAIIIALLALIPYLNIILFIAFIIYYIVHCSWNPKYCDGYTYVFSLRGLNFLKKSIRVIKEFLNKKI